MNLRVYKSRARGIEMAVPKLKKADVEKAAKQWQSKYGIRIIGPTDSAPAPNKKKCSICKSSKGHSDYHKNKNNPDGLQRYCKLCAAKSQKRTKSKPPLLQWMDMKIPDIYNVYKKFKREIKNDKDVPKEDRQTLILICTVLELEGQPLTENEINKAVAHLEFVLEMRLAIKKGALTYNPKTNEIGLPEWNK